MHQCHRSNAPFSCEKIKMVIGDQKMVTEDQKGFFPPELSTLSSKLFRLDDTYSPRIEVFEKNNNIIIKVDLPGLEKTDINIDLKKDEITVSGERKKEDEVSDENYYSNEKTFNEFSRTIALPCKVDRNKTYASCKNGVLTITAPKSESEMSKKVEVK